MSKVQSRWEDVELQENDPIQEKVTNFINSVIPLKSDMSSRKANLYVVHTNSRYTFSMKNILGLFQMHDPGWSKRVNYAA